jgi:hypothetical protein
MELKKINKEKIHTHTHTHPRNSFRNNLPTKPSPQKKIPTQLLQEGVEYPKHSF